MKLFLLQTFVITIFCRELKTSLKSVHIIFRHGMRNPKTIELYPSDPYLSYFTTDTYGQLTANGKKESFELGRFIRQRYGDLIGKNYNSDDIFATSTPSDRTLTTLHMVLSGMYDVTPQTVTNGIASLPFSIQIGRQDIELYEDNFNCPTYYNEYNSILLSTEYENLRSAYKDTFDYITKKSEKNISDFKGANSIYHTLCAEQFLNLELPTWTHSVYPDKIHLLAATWLYFANYNSLMKRLNGGKTLKDIMDQIQLKIDGNFNAPNIFLYSGHDRTIVSVLAALELYEIHIPKYNSALFMEMHEVHPMKQYILKFFYLRDIHSDPQELVIPRCENLCQVNTFHRVFGHHIPTNHTEECFSVTK